MIYTAVVLVACWALAVYGVLSHGALSWRMTRRRTVFPVRGMRVATARVPARLADLSGESGLHRGLLWARTANGIACRPSGHWFSVVGECRQDGADVVVDAVLPQGVRLLLMDALVIASRGLSCSRATRGPRPIVIRGSRAYVARARRKGRARDENGSVAWRQNLPKVPVSS